MVTKFSQKSEKSLQHGLFSNVKIRHFSATLSDLFPLVNPPKIISKSGLNVAYFYLKTCGGKWRIFTKYLAEF